MKFGKLVWKELKGSRLTVVVFIVLVVLWYVFLLTRVGVWPQSSITGMATLPFLLLPLWVIGSMLYMFHMEWSTNSIYLLLSLPVRGWKVLAAKLTAALVDMLLLGVVSFMSFWLMFGYQLWQEIQPFQEGVPVQWVISLGLKFLLGYLFFVVVALVTAQLSYLTSRLVSRFNGLLLGATFFVQFWLFVRLGGLLAPFFTWLPDITLRGWYTSGGVVHVSTEILETGPFIIVLLLTAGFFAFSAWLYEKEIEV